MSGNETNYGDTVALVEALEEPVEDVAKGTTIDQSGNIENDPTIFHPFPPMPQWEKTNQNSHSLSDICQ